MTTRAFDVGYRPGGAAVVAWAGLRQGDDGAGIEVGGWSLFGSLQVVGTFAGGAKLVLEGSNDGGAHWAAVHDASDDPIEVNGEELVTCAALPLMVRPKVTGGNASTVLAVYLVGRVR